MTNWTLAWLITLSFYGCQSKIPNDLTIAGPDNQVRIGRGAHSIPIVHAGSIRDAYFGIGYVHAMDRLWQMDIRRRYASGTLGEIIGSLTIEDDIYMRHFQLREAAHSSLASLDEKTRGELNAYAAGVNQAVYDGWLPPEYTILFSEFTEWNAEDSILVQKLMGYDLAQNEIRELIRTAISSEIGEERAEEILVSSATQAPGSNGWVISGKYTESGMPIIANDPHLGIEVPGVWYLAGISLPDHEVKGAYIAGIPYTISGTNQHIAWGVTNLMADVVDLTDMESLKKSGKMNFDIVEKSHKFVTRWGTTQDHVIRTTKWGPVLGSEFSSLYEKDLLIQGVWEHPRDGTLSALSHLQGAKNVAQAEEALKGFVSPALNFLVSDSSNNIARFIVGYLPQRASSYAKALNTDLPITDFFAEQVSWDQRPHVVNPRKGYIIATNERPEGLSKDVYISDSWDGTFRYGRIDDLLSARINSATKFQVSDLAAIQNDTVSNLWLEVKHLFSKLTLKGRDFQEITKQFSEWDGDYTLTAWQPVLFETWKKEFMGLVLEDEFSEKAWLKFRRLRNADLLHSLLISSGSMDPKTWCDNKITKKDESCNDMVTSAFSLSLLALKINTLSDAQQHTWGAYHESEYKHLILGSLPVIGGLLGWSHPSAGSDETVSLGGLQPNGDFKMVSGPTMRMIIDQGDDSVNSFILDTGQSGNFFSEFYDDLNELHRSGKYVQISRGESHDH
jgi:penicillin amidase